MFSYRNMGDVRWSDHRRGKSSVWFKVRTVAVNESDWSRSSPFPSPPLSLRQMAEQLMTLAYENGINLFDTAEVYAAGK